MNSHEKIINFTKLITIFLFFTGTFILIYGISGNIGSIIGIGIGVEVGAIFIVLMSMFFVATEEMVETTIKGIEITAKKSEQPHLYVVKRS
jgi:divalent metal cation (Fe/Co/Zn/Cd) transporter